MDRRDILAESVLACKMLTARYLAGFDDANHTRQAPGLPNHVAWSLGHCALTMHRVAERFDGQPMPGADFGPGRDAFEPERVAFGSTPAPDPAKFPPMARCVRVYEAACDRLAAAVRGAPGPKLDEFMKWGPQEITLASAVSRMVFHNGTHTGQIADLRRALGMKSIFG